jgi:hypothetical protein
MNTIFAGSEGHQPYPVVVVLQIVPLGLGCQPLLGTVVVVRGKRVRCTSVLGGYDEFIKPIIDLPC